MLVGGGAVGEYPKILCIGWKNVLGKRDALE